MELSGKIIEIHHESRATYGSPRVLKKLRYDGETINPKAVASIMKGL